MAIHSCLRLYRNTASLITIYRGFYIQANAIEIPDGATGKPQEKVRTEPEKLKQPTTSGTKQPPIVVPQEPGQTVGPKETRTPRYVQDGSSFWLQRDIIISI